MGRNDSLPPWFMNSALMTESSGREAQVAVPVVGLGCSCFPNNNRGGTEGTEQA